MLDVITIGSATLDVFVKSDRFKDGKIGEGKIEAQELIMISGGGATNNAVSFARKGLSIAPIIEMGTDPAAEMILSELKKEGVNVQLSIQEEKETTAVSIILLSDPSADGGKSSIFTYRGASRMLTASDIPFDKLGFLLKPSGWIHLTSIGGDLELVGKILSWAKEKRRKIFWNPGAKEISNFRKGLTLRQGQTLLDAVKVLQLNRFESSEFFGINFTDDKVWKAEHCPVLPQTILIITDGEKGGRICYNGECTWYQGIKTSMVDSTGAGDAFGSGFMSALLLGKPISEAIEWGRRQGANVVKYIGAKKGLMTIEELKKTVGPERVCESKGGD